MIKRVKSCDLHEATSNHREVAMWFPNIWFVMHDELIAAWENIAVCQDKIWGSIPSRFTG